jgi:hypothetical protein
MLILLLSTALTAAAGERYFNQEHGFSLDVPSGWVVSKSAQPNTVVKFVYRDTEGHIAILSVAAYVDSGTELTTDGMYASFQREYRDFTYRRIASGTSRIRSMDAVWNLIEITDPPQARIIGKHYHFRRNSKLWRVSAMTDSGRNFFDQVLPAMDQAIATLAFRL